MTEIEKSTEVETIELISEPNYFSEISNILNLTENQISTVLEFVVEWATVPFIARYRKEKTGNLDEEQIREILKEKTRIENLYEAKKTALNGIFEQGKLTDELKQRLWKKWKIFTSHTNQRKKQKLWLRLKMDFKLWLMKSRKIKIFLKMMKS